MDEGHMMPTEAHIWTDEELEEIVREAMPTFTEVQAQFACTVDLKVKWTRLGEGGGRWIDMEVSDYLNKAPRAVLYDVFHKVECSINMDSFEYTPETLAWFDNCFLSAENRASRMAKQRLRGVDFDGNSEQAKRLMDMVGRIREDGAPFSDDIIFGYTDRIWRNGSISLLFKEVIFDKNIASLSDEELEQAIVDNARDIVPYSKRHRRLIN